MIKIILISILIVGIAIFGLCFNIIFKKDGKFPDGEVGHNKELRKRGIVCVREDDERLWGKSSYIKITKNKSGEKRVKFMPDSACERCSADCSFGKLNKKR